MNIREAIQRLANTGGEMYCKICTVDKVDVDARTVDCTPIDDSAPLLGVNLQANQDSEHGIVAFPKEGSYVVVAFINPAVAVVVLTDEVEKVEIVVGESKIEVTDGKIGLNGGDSPLIMIDALTAKINDFITTFNLHTHSNGNAGAATGRPASLATSLSADDYKDKKIVH